MTQQELELRTARHPHFCDGLVLLAQFYWLLSLSVSWEPWQAKDILSRPLLTSPLTHSHIRSHSFQIELRRKMQSSCILLILPLGFQGVKLVWSATSHYQITGLILGLPHHSWYDLNAQVSHPPVCSIISSFMFKKKKKKIKHNKKIEETWPVWKCLGGFSQNWSRMSQQGDVDDRRTNLNLNNLERTEAEWRK